MSALPTGTVTFLFTDIEGSTELVRLLRGAYRQVRSEHRRLLRDVFETYGGHEIDTQGDGFFVAFEQAGNAVGAAAAVQRSLAAVEWPAGAQLRVRIGIHTAEPFVDEEGYVGIGVHRAARICAAAHGGQILLSNATAGIVEDHELEGTELRDIGEYQLKDMTRPQRLFEVAVEGLAAIHGPPNTLDRVERERFGGIVTFLVVDGVQWHRLLRERGDEVVAEITGAYHRLVREAVAANEGRVYEIAADNAIAIFDRAGKAVEAGSALRESLRHAVWPHDATPEFRLALHTGRLIAEHLAGLALFHCVLLCSSAEPWQVLVSHATQALLEGERLEGIDLRALGDRPLPGYDEPSYVYGVVG